MNASQTSLIGGLSLGALLTGLLLQSQDTYTVGTSHSPHGPDIFVSGMHLDVMDDTGVLQYRLQAETMNHYPGDDRITLTQPVMEVLSGEQPRWQIESERSEMDDKGELVWLLGEVRIRRHQTGESQAVVIHTRDLAVRPDSRTADTEQRAVISSGQYTIEGVGMHADFTTDRLEIDSRVRGRIDVAG